MPRFAANISMLYPEWPFLDRIDAAARDGFTAIECQFPYAWPAAEVRHRVARDRLEMVLINTPASSVAAGVADRGMHPGERGFGCVTGREADFREGVLVALDYAATLGVSRIHAMVGLAADGSDRARLRETLLENLAWASAQTSDTTFVIEPINPRDMPGYFLSTQADAHAIVDDVGSPRVKVLMDLYHCQIVEGDLATKLERYLPTGRVGHLQIAGAPRRHEPDDGEIHYPYLFERIDALGWDGWIGCEYRPRDPSPGGTSAGLGWRTS